MSIIANAYDMQTTMDRHTSDSITRTRTWDELVGHVSVSRLEFQKLLKIGPEKWDVPATCHGSTVRRSRPLKKKWEERETIDRERGLKNSRT